MNTQPTLLDNWIGWLQARIPALKESHNVYWLKQAMGGYKSENEQYFPKDSEPVAPIDKTLSSEDYLNNHYKRLGHSSFTEAGLPAIVKEFMTDFANLRVEQAKEEWEEKLKIREERLKHPLYPFLKK